MIDIGECPNPKNPDVDEDATRRGNNDNDSVGISGT
jgi:hypothetical protein